MGKKFKIHIVWIPNQICVQVLESSIRSGSLAMLVISVGSGFNVNLAQTLLVCNTSYINRSQRISTIECNYPNGKSKHVAGSDPSIRNNSDPFQTFD